MPYFSVITPVYNRIDEIRDLLDSLSKQTNKNFEVIIVEDGSTTPCKSVVECYSETLNVKYFYKSNEYVLEFMEIEEKEREKIIQKCLMLERSQNKTTM